MGIKYNTRTQHMVQQVINVGNVANDGDGDPLRIAFIKTNDNFTQLYNANGITGLANGSSNITILNSGVINMSSAGVANVVVVTSTGVNITGTSPKTMVANIVSATGNVVAGSFFIGNGSQLSGVTSTTDANTLTGNTLKSTVINSSLTSVGTLGTLAVSGNVDGGNLRTSGQISSAGNVLGQNLNTGGVVSATGNVTGGNFNTGGLISNRSSQRTWWHRQCRNWKHQLSRYS